jgi:hypothetical protein
MPQVHCLFCKEKFYAKPSWIKNGYGKYCSQQCNHASQKNGQVFTCSVCKKEVYRSIKHQLRSKSSKYFCSKSCQAVWRNTTYIGDKHPNWKHGLNVYRNILKRTAVNQVCTKCKGSDTRILAVHHKDKNRQNNTATNLIWLCHNCHFLVHHYRGEAEGFLD